MKLKTEEFKDLHLTNVLNGIERLKISLIQLETVKARMGLETDSETVFYTQEDPLISLIQMELFKEQLKISNLLKVLGNSIDPKFYKDIISNNITKETLKIAYNYTAKLIKKVYTSSDKKIELIQEVQNVPTPEIKEDIDLAGEDISSEESDSL